MKKERLDRYILEAAKATDYEEGFGAIGCDLSLSQWWVAYTRQSTREQSENDRLGEYHMFKTVQTKRRHSTEGICDIRY